MVAVVVRLLTPHDQERVPPVRVRGCSEEDDEDEDDDEEEEEASWIGRLRVDTCNPTDSQPHDDNVQRGKRVARSKRSNVEAAAA